MSTLKSTVAYPSACGWGRRLVLVVSITGRWWSASLWHHVVPLPVTEWGRKPAAHTLFYSCSSHVDTRWRCRPSVTLAALCQSSAWLPHWSPSQYCRESTSPCVPRRSSNLLEMSRHPVTLVIPLSDFEDPGGVSEPC